MVRCGIKRRRGFDHSPPTTSESADDSAASAVRIGCDSPTNYKISNRPTEACSIRDDIEPARRQSSLLSFFTKEKKAKPPQKSKHQIGESRSQSDVRSVKTSRTLSSSPGRPSSSSSNRRTHESQSQKGGQTKPLTRCLPTESKQKKSKTLTQVYLDCGQSKFGQILCDKCGMLYMPGIPEDEKQHKTLCQAFTLGIPCNRGTIKGGREVKIQTNENDRKCNNDESTIILWRPCVKAKNNKKSKFHRGTTKSFGDDSSSDKNRPSQWPLLARMISKDLGTDEDTTLNHLTNEIVVLYIGRQDGTKNHKGTNTRHRILGVATVQMLGRVPAYRMINLYERSLTPSKEGKLGIGLLWTHPVARHRGIATKLVHAAREHSVFGMRVTRQEVAFSNPTQAGYDFALRYCDNSENPEKASDSLRRRGPLVYEMSL